MVRPTLERYKKKKNPTRTFLLFELITWVLGSIVGTIIGILIIGGAISLIFGGK